LYIGFAMIAVIRGSSPDDSPAELGSAAEQVTATSTVAPAIHARVRVAVCMAFDLSLDAPTVSPISLLQPGLRRNRAVHTTDAAATLNVETTASNHVGR
jgi:hypothetical protein